MSMEAALGFRSNVSTGPPDLLLQTLSFLCSSADLASCRGVCRDFRQVSDAIAKLKIEELIGKGVKPMVGQSITGLLHGAEEADDTTREYLRNWDARAGGAEGFDVGLPTVRDYRCHVLALVGSGTAIASPERFVPVKLSFKQRLNDADHIGTMAYLPRGFFHVNAYRSGWFQVCRYTQADFDRETNIIDTLRRIKRDLANPYILFPHSADAMRLYLTRSKNHRVRRRFDADTRPSEVYSEYLKMCFDMFVGYGLGRPVPELEVFDRLVKMRVELLKFKR